MRISDWSSDVCSSDLDDNYFKQPGDLFRLMTPEQQQALFDNTARAMGDAPDFIKQRHVDNCTKADPAYGAGVEAALRKLGAFAGTTSDRKSTRLNSSHSCASRLPSSA